MGSMDSLLELAPGAVPEAEAPTPQRKQKQSRAQQETLGRLSGGSHSRSTDTSASAEPPNILPGSNSIRAASGRSGASGGGNGIGEGDADGIDPTLAPQAAALAAMRLTPDQRKLLLTVRRAALCPPSQAQHGPPASECRRRL